MNLPPESDRTPSDDIPSPRGKPIDGPTVDQLQEGLGDDFQVKRILGQGAMAVVYLATEVGLDRPVAIKVLRGALSTNETARARFEREARASASLLHPTIVPVYRYGRLPEGQPYLVMRFVKGRTMEERIEAEGRMDLGTARSTLLAVAEALEVAHAAGIIHRDIRPANILWDQESERALLADFGIAALLEPTGEQATRLTTAGQVLGDPTHMSPEQLREEPITEAVDIYALGVVGYELLAGRGPYDGKSPVQLITAHLQSEPRPLEELRGGVPADLADLLRRCLNKDPAKRPRAADLVRVLRAAQAPAAGVGAPAGAALAGQASYADELMRRGVPKIAILAVSGGVALVALSAQLVEMEVFDRIAYLLAWPLAVCGVLAAAVVGWFHGEAGRQRAPALEYALLAVIAVIWIAWSWLILQG